MKKINIFSSLLLTTIFAFISNGADYLFKGTDGDLSNVSNYYSLTLGQINDVYSQAVCLYESDYAGDMKAHLPETGAIYGKYSAATTLPATTDTIYIYTYRFADTSSGSVVWGTSVTPTSPYYMKSSLTANELLMRGSGTQSITFGSSTASESSFSLNVKNFRVGYTNANFYIDEKSTQKTFAINVSGEMTLRGGANTRFNFGKSSKYFNSISINTAQFQSITNIYTERMNTVGNLSLAKSATLNIYFNDAVFDFSNAESFLTVGGTFTRAADSTNKITLDFSNVAFSELNSGVYNLISAAALSGFTKSDLTSDFSTATFDSIAAVFGDKASLAWNGNTLQLSIVPEPAAFAAILGFGAIAIAFFRRSLKNK